MSSPSVPIGVPSVVDLFAGPGGLGEGFRQAGFFVAAAVENDPYAQKTLSQNAGARGTLVIQSDIRRLNLSGNVDRWSGGHPAKAFQSWASPKSSTMR